MLLMHGWVSSSRTPCFVARYYQTTEEGRLTRFGSVIHGSRQMITSEYRTNRQQGNYNIFYRCNMIPSFLAFHPESKQKRNINLIVGVRKKPSAIAWTQMEKFLPNIHSPFFLSNSCLRSRHRGVFAVESLDEFGYILGQRVSGFQGVFIVRISFPFHKVI